MESIAEITPAMLYNSCKAFYAPGNMVLAAAGNTTMEQILAACERHGLMEPRPAQKVQRLWATEPMTLAATEKTLTMPVSKPCFGVGFKDRHEPGRNSAAVLLYLLRSLRTICAPRRCTILCSVASWAECRRCTAAYMTKVL